MLNIEELSKVSKQCQSKIEHFIQFYTHIYIMYIYIYIYIYIYTHIYIIYIYVNENKNEQKKDIKKREDAWDKIKNY